MLLLGWSAEAKVLARHILIWPRFNSILESVLRGGLPGLLLALDFSEPGVGVSGSEVDQAQGNAMAPHLESGEGGKDDCDNHEWHHGSGAGEEFDEEPGGHCAKEKEMGGKNGREMPLSHDERCDKEEGDSKLEVAREEHEGAGRESQRGAEIIEACDALRRAHDFWKGKEEQHRDTWSGREVIGDVGFLGGEFGFHR